MASKLVRRLFRENIPMRQHRTQARKAFFSEKKKQKTFPF
jgi:hypothetical protein